MTARMTTSADGTRIAYDISGRGPALMLLHGAGKSRRDWHKLGYVERLKDDFMVITVDLRGTGDSDYLVEVEDYDIEKICQDLYTVADACSAQRFGIWGFSLGGNIARYPAAWSDRISSIAVIGVPFGPAVDQAFDAYICGWEKKYGHLAEKEKSEIIAAGKTRSAIKGRMAGWLACFNAMRSWPNIDPDQIRCPAILVVGTRNKNTMRWIDQNQKAMDQAGVALQIMESLTHNQEFTTIEQVFQPIYQFLKTPTNAT